MNPVLPPGVSFPGGSPPPQDGPLVVLAKVLERTPRYLFHFVLAMLIASLEDPISTALTIAAVAVGGAAGSWVIGVAFFFGVYVIVRTINNVASAIGRLPAQEQTPPQA